MKRRNKKKASGIVTAFVLAAFIVASVAGCGKETPGDSGNPGDKGGGTGGKQDVLTVAINGDVGDLSPFSTSATAPYLWNQIYEPLFDQGYDMEMTPLLAESWEQVDQTHYTMKIREGVTDSEGNTFTAHDAVFVFETYTTDAENSTYVANIDFDKTVASDDYTLELYLLQPNNYTFTNLSGVRMFTKAAWEASKDQMVTEPVGTGAYKLKGFVSGSYVEIEARDDYWGGTPEIKNVKFSVIAEPSQATTALETGEVDIVMGLQASDQEYVDSKEGLKTLVNPAIRSMGMYLNMSENSVFRDKNVRQALCYAVDNAGINKVVYGGLAFEGVCPFSSAMMDYEEGMDGDMYGAADMGKAKELLKEAGVSGGKIKIATDGSSEETAIAEILQSTLMELGFTAEINNYDMATIWDVASNPTQWDIVLQIAAAPSGYGLDQLQAFLVALNWSKWSGEDFDKFNGLYQEAIMAGTPEESRKKAVEAVKLVEETAQTYAFVQLSDIYGYKDNLNFRVWNQNSLLVKDLKFE